MSLSTVERDFIARGFTRHVALHGSTPSSVPSTVALLTSLNIHAAQANEAAMHFWASHRVGYLMTLGDAEQVIARCKAQFEAERASVHPDEDDAVAAVDALRASAFMSQSSAPQPLPPPDGRGASSPAPRRQDTSSSSSLALVAKRSLALDGDAVDTLFANSESDAQLHRTLLPDIVPPKVIHAMRRLGGYYDESMDHWMIALPRVAAAGVPIPESFLLAESLTRVDAINQNQFYRLIASNAASQVPSSPSRRVGPDASARDSITRERSVVAALHGLDLDDAQTVPADPSEALLNRMTAATDLHNRRISPLRQAKPLHKDTPSAAPSDVLGTQRQLFASNATQPIQGKPTLSACLATSRTIDNKARCSSTSEGAKAPVKVSRSRPSSGSARQSSQPQYMSFPAPSGSLIAQARRTHSTPSSPTYHKAGKGQHHNADESRDRIQSPSKQATPYSRPTTPTSPLQGQRVRVVYLPNEDGELVKHFLVRAASPAPSTNPRTIVRDDCDAEASKESPIETDGREEARNTLRDDNETVSDDFLIDEMRARHAARFIQTRMRVWIASLKSRSGSNLQRIGRGYLYRRRVGLIPVAIRMAGDRMVRTKRAHAMLLRLQRVGRASVDRKALGEFFATFSERRAINDFLAACGITRVGKSNTMPPCEAMDRLHLRSKRRTLPCEDERRRLDDEFVEELRNCDQTEEALDWDE